MKAEMEMQWLFACFSEQVSQEYDRDGEDVGWVF